MNIKDFVAVAEMANELELYPSEWAAVNIDFDNIRRFKGTRSERKMLYHHMAENARREGTFFFESKLADVGGDYSHEITRVFNGGGKLVEAIMVSTFEYAPNHGWASIQYSTSKAGGAADFCAKARRLPKLVAASFTVGIDAIPKLNAYTFDDIIEHFDTFSQKCGYFPKGQLSIARDVTGILEKKGWKLYAHVERTNMKHPVSASAMGGPVKRVELGEKYRILPTTSNPRDMNQVRDAFLAVRNQGLPCFKAPIIKRDKKKRADETLETLFIGADHAQFFIPVEDTKGNKVAIHVPYTRIRQYLNGLTMAPSTV